MSTEDSKRSNDQRRIQNTQNHLEVRVFDEMDSDHSHHSDGGRLLDDRNPVRKTNPKNRLETISRDPIENRKHPQN
ncbi:hypothetical protein GWI33_006587 [Rhynchophorus ferrugineus]|uniref:Uncharacterized protein n=1 Tax=Rhynchophorus ferrugineus TaxID=354439 RepID=A0A834IER4_RHYFE|nr:hypothetical protein GWI33_006587 [Rhynchophorus ferrugineus]